MRILNIIKLKIEAYEKIWNFQKQLHKLRVDGEIDDTVILLEHTPTYTLGKSADSNHLLADKSILNKENIKVFEIDRGGDVTYHGPGQLVGYPIIKLDDLYLDIHRYLRDLEKVIIRSLGEFNIKARREEDYTGVWVGDSKIAAIGIKVSRWITMHGFAFNINTDLSYFNRIIPCGIFEKGVTSLQNEIGTYTDMEIVKDIVIQHFTTIFKYEKLNYFDSLEGFENHLLIISEEKSFG